MDMATQNKQLMQMTGAGEFSAEGEPLRPFSG